MCLEKISEQKITTQPIFVYKNLDKYNNSLGTGYKYEQNVLNPEVTIKPKKPLYKDDIIIMEAYHSRKNKNNNSAWFNTNSLFVIPSGTIYYEGKENDDDVDNYASENIIFLGKIDGIFGAIKEWYYKKQYLNNNK